jgi:uncharacterized protein YaaW (UPF0174 family)
MHESNRKLIKLFKKVPLDRLEPIYTRHCIDPSEGVEALIEEICLDGSNTFASILRGWQGVSYMEIVKDVAQRMNVEINDDTDEEKIEIAILAKVFQKSLKKVSPQERKQVMEILKQAGEDTKLKNIARYSSLSAVSLALLIKEIGGRTTAGVLERMMAKAVARESAKRIGGIVGLTLPLLSLAMIGWTAFDVTGPAYRKIIPTVMEVSLLRLEYGEKDKGKEEKVRKMVGKKKGTVERNKIRKEVVLNEEIH